MADQPEFVWTLFRDAIIALSMTPEEQRRVNGPGCLACDLLNGFDHAQRTFVAHFGDALTSEQRDVVDKMKLLIAAMQADDTECFNDDVVRRQIWQLLRETATDARRLFRFEDAKLDPFVETEPGVWRRPPSH